MQDTLDAKNSYLNFTFSESRIKGISNIKNANLLKNNQATSIMELDQTLQAFHKASHGNLKNIIKNAEICALDQYSIQNRQQNFETITLNKNKSQSRVSKTEIRSLNPLSCNESEKTKYFENEQDNLCNLEDEYENESNYHKNNLESQQSSTQLFANIRQTKIFQQMRDYVRTLKKNKIIQKFWFCQINSRWTRQKQLNVSFLMMSICIISILLICWVLLLFFMYRIFDDTYYPNYSESEKNQLIYTLSSLQESLVSLLRRTDHLHQVAISIYQSQQKGPKNPFYDINFDSHILKGKQNYISINQDVSPQFNDTLGFYFQNVDTPITYDFFQWATFIDQRNYTHITPESQKILDDFDILSYFIKNLIANAKFSSSYSYYCGFETDELVVYYPAGLQNALRGKDKVPDFSFHPNQRDWYSQIIKNNLQYTNQTYFTLPYKDQITQQYIMTMSVALRDQDGKFQGVCATDYYLDKFDKYINSIGINEYSIMALIDASNDNSIILTQNSSIINFTPQQFLQFSPSQWTDMKQQILQTFNNNTNSLNSYSYFQDIQGFKVAGSAFKSKNSNDQTFILLVKESTNQFERLYDTIIQRVQDKYIKPNINFIIAFLVISFAHIIYCLIMSYYVTQPYRKIKQISNQITQNLKASNQIGSLDSYLNTLDFKSDRNLYILVKSAKKMVLKIQKASTKKIIENQKYYHAYHYEQNEYFDSQMEWRDEIEQLVDYGLSKNFNSLPTNLEFFNDCESKITELRDNSPFAIVNNKQESLKIKQKILSEDSFCKSVSVPYIDQKFMNHIEQYLPNFQMP
uniref:Anlagen stage induced 1 protein n=1 Tax=Tetrahymena thermophila TaxID=5911 RepID=Q8WRL8_TETTH|nr:anlagen stage induced 1 protein [Tetrahymena thermophila]